MILGIVFWIGLAFIIVVLVKGLQRPNRTANDGGNIPPVINDADSNNRRWLNDTNILAADRAEYFNLLEKHSADPLHIPAPIPPSKPHPYWGNEADTFGNGTPSGEEVD
ncbi:MAG: hypothetical protein ACREDS_15560 [Limisphaerales bacterium]